MIKQSLPAVSEVTKDTLEEFKKADKVVLVAFVDAADKASSEAFSAAAEKLRDNYPFGVSTDAALAEAEGVTAPAVVLYKDFDEGKSVFSEKFDAEAIEKFAKTSATPLIGEVGPETYSDYMSAGIPLAYIFAETAEERKEITFEAIKAFVDDFVAGKVEPSIKSEPIPETQGPVTVVVAKNYNDIVLDDTKDVLIEFYAPWCGHCKALAPKYEELGTLYAESEFKDKVVIAKVDATANDVPDEIQGFPTIKLYPAGAKDKAVTYSGSRTVEDLIKFIAENGKYKAVVEEKAEEPAAEPAAEAASETKAEAAKETEHDEL